MAPAYAVLGSEPIQLPLKFDPHEVPHTLIALNTIGPLPPQPRTTGTVSEYLLNFGPYYVLHTLVAALAHSRLGWRKGLRYFWRAQQEPVYLIFTFIRASAIVALGLPVRACVGFGVV